MEVRAIYGQARLQHVLSLLGYKQINTSVIERLAGAEADSQCSLRTVRTLNQIQ